VNTRVHYMYRDGSNYKQYEEVVFSGEITADERRTVAAALDGNDLEWFLPEQVGLETLYDRFETHFDDDHPWHELYEIEVTDALPTQDEDIHAFAARFEGIQWDLAAAMKPLAEWIDATPQGR
jgi:hypothetical protein